jgi:hypothetical protein
VYLDERPCDLEPYYQTTGSADREAAARRCVKRDPVFAYNVWSPTRQRFLRPATASGLPPRFSTVA